MPLPLETVPCSFCNSIAAIPFLHQDGFTIVQCTGCGLLYVNPRPPRSAISAYYASSYYAHSQRKGLAARLHHFRQGLLLAIAFNHLGYPLPPDPAFADYRRFPWRFLAALFHQRFNRLPPYTTRATSPRSLDIGCGSGAYVSLLQQLGWDAWGIEPDPAGVQLAHAAGCPNVHLGTLEDHTFPPHSFDLVTCWDSLEHTFDPGQILLDAQRLLKPGGWLYLKVPHPLCLEARLWRQHWVGYDLPRHLYHFSPRLLQDFLSRHGFQLHAFRFVSPPNLIASGLILGLARRWPRLAFLHRLDTFLTIAFVPLAWLLDRLGTGNTYQIIARNR